MGKTNKKTILITGACGFIGTNAVRRFSKDNNVIGIDNLSRKGSEKNLDYLRHACDFEFIHHDIRPPLDLPKVDIIYHFAAQVGMVTAMDNPREDFDVNALGTFNVLEYARRCGALVVFPSTNKVYGCIDTGNPVNEDTRLSFETPYGCSKGAADQYVLDYNRVYDLPTVVFRQSCIYGPHQQGSEAQGWIAWFLIANKTRQPLTIFGDGNQVRDILYIDDLLDLYELATDNQDKVAGKAYNIGGGPNNILSLNELVEKQKIDIPISFADWRKADQKYYVSDIGKIKRDLGWEPKVGVDEGLAKLREYVEKNW